MIRLGLLGVLAALTAAFGAGAQELEARPTEPVAVSTLAGATTPDALVEGPLRALVAASSTLTVEQADALLHESYDAFPTPTTRSRAFGVAALVASSAGRHELALAWSDWAIREAEQAPERDLLLAERLEEAVGMALAAGNPVLAREQARRAAGHAPGGRDDAESRSVVFARPGLSCPDVIEDAYLRTRAGAAQTEPGLLASASAECVYIPIQGPREAGFRLYAVRSFMALDERAREVVERGLEAREVEARAEIQRRLTGLSTMIEPLFLDGGGEGRLGYARYDRPGVDDVAAFAYAAAARDGVFYAAAASARDWAWPPEELGRRAAAGLAAALAVAP